MLLAGTQVAAKSIRKRVSRPSLIFTFFLTLGSA